MQCKVEGCERDAHYKAAQLCQKHYFRLWRYGTTDTTKHGHAKPRQESPEGYQWIYEPTHPLGHTKSSYVAEHRAVLYADLGEGPLSCELCSKPLTWKTCHVDHIDCNVKNNARSNLRPTCSKCNTRRGMREPAYWNRTIAIEFEGVVLTPHEWSRDPRVQVTGSTIRRRIKEGMSPAQALFGPKVTHNGNKKVRKGPPRPQVQIKFAGRSMTASEWAREPGVTVSNITILKRVRSGWPAGMALYNPAADFMSGHKQKLRELKEKEE